MQAEFGLRHCDRAPPQPSQQLANGGFADADPAGNLALRMPRGPQSLHQASTRLWHPGPASGKSPRPRQIRQSSFFKAALVPSYGSNGTPKGSGDLGLRRPTLLDQTHHRVRGGQGIGTAVLCQNNTGDQHHAMLILGS
jgi:hypothetical protein